MGLKIKIKNLLAIIITAAINYNLFASSYLNVLPVKGGNSIRFGYVDNSQIKSEEVRLRISSSSNTHYQVRQRLLTPIANQQGVILPDNALQFYTVRGSNSSGTLYKETPSNLSFADEVIYSSSSQGNSDSFIIVYILNGQNIPVSGHYRGQIIYSLELQGSGRAETQVVNIDFDAEVNNKITITPLSSGTSINLSYPRNNEDGVKISLPNSYGKQISLFQNLELPPQNEYGNILPSESLQLKIKDNSNLEANNNFPNYSLFSRNQELLYTYRGKGGEILLLYSFNQKRIADIPAGVYRGRIVYTIEGGDLASNVFSFPFNIEIEPVFDIKVAAPSGFSFANIKPTGLAEEKEIIIKVNSNLKRPYAISQIINQPLIDEQGNRIPEDLFTLKVIIPDNNQGSTDFSNPKPVKDKNSIIYISDNQGSSVEIKLIYCLTPSYEIKAGNYKANITYSLLEN